MKSDKNFNLINDKIGGEKWLSPWWYLVIVMISGGIVLATLIFYSAEYDVRSVEANLLTEKIADCVIENGFLVQEFTESNINFNVYAYCNLERSIFDEEMFFKVSVFNENKNKLFFANSLENQIENSVFEVNCELKEDARAEKFGECSNKKFVVYYYEDGEKHRGYVEIATVSNQKGRKVSLV